MRESWQPESGQLASALVLGLLVASAASTAVAQATCGNGAACAGDCDRNGSVTVDEIVTMVSAALSGGDGGCSAGDIDDGGSVTVDEIITAVNFALGGCGGAAGLDPGEECDDAGRCVGGADAGDACTSEGDCEGDGACFGGLDDLRGCRSDDDCREGTCRKCRPYGGDGCAANCTNETDNEYVLVPGEVESTRDSIVFGTSGAVLFDPATTVPLPMTGSQVLTTGKIIGGQAPVVVRTTVLNAIPSSSICACVRGTAASTCGGTLFNVDGTESPNCTPGFGTTVECPADKKCAAVHGPGNTGSGWITCGGSRIDQDVTQDCNVTPGGEPFDPVVTVDRVPIPVPPDKGSAHLVVTAAIGLVLGACNGTTGDYGPDGQFCTQDDPTSSRGRPISIPFTTGTAVATVLNPSDFEDVLGPFITSGTPFSCDGDAIAVHGANLASAFTVCDPPPVGLEDVVAVLNFVAE